MKSHLSHEIEPRLCGRNIVYVSHYTDGDNRVRPTDLDKGRTISYCTVLTVDILPLSGKHKRLQLNLKHVT